MATQVDPYKQLQSAYNAQKNAVNAANEAQIQERANRERQAQAGLNQANRAANTAFVRMNSPQNKFQQQNNFSTGVSDYLKNASYGTYLKGLGANQQNYNEAMNNSNALWNNWLAQKAGQEAQNAGDYADRMIAQGNKDRDFNYQKERDTVADKQWQTQFDWNKMRDARDFDYQKGRDAVSDSQWQKTFDYNKYVGDRNYNYQVERDKVGDQQWQKQFDENVRQFGLEYALRAGAASGGSGGGGGSYYSSGGGPGNPTPVLSPTAQDTVSRTRMYGDINDKTAARKLKEGETTSSGAKYKAGYDTYVNANGVVVSQKKTGSTSNGKRKQYTAYDKNAKRKLTYNTGFAKGIF